MSDDLRTRISRVLSRHYPQTTGCQDELTDWCQCGMPRDHVADTLIRELGWQQEFGLQFDKHPTDVVMGRDRNPDGTVTQVFEMSELRARQALDSPAPIGGINKRVVTRFITDWTADE